MQAKVTALCRYPIKACGALALNAAVLDALGIEHDRRWMVVGAEDGTFLSQRSHPRLAAIRPAVEGDFLIVRSPGEPPLTLPLGGAEFAKSRLVSVWKAAGVAEDAGDNAALWFSRILRAPCRLVRAGAAWDRPLNPAFSTPGDRTGFADGYPVLLASEASLRDLNTRLETPVSMDRFRPNIVIDGSALAAWAEDGWRTLTIGGVRFRAAKPCARCAVPTIDQATGEMRGPEPMRALAAYRRDADGNVLFAINLIHEEHGAIRVGDAVEITG
jgi:uncharacterized protein YcbX